MWANEPIKIQESDNEYLPRAYKFFLFFGLENGEEIKYHIAVTKFVVLNCFLSYFAI